MRRNRQKKLFWTSLVVGIFLGATPPCGAGGHSDNSKRLAALVRHADIIVQGELLSSHKIKQQRVAGYVGHPEQSLAFHFGDRDQLNFRVTAVYEGQEEALDTTIPIIVAPHSLYNKRPMRAGQTYIVFLRRPSSAQGRFRIMDQGRAYWRVFDYAGTAKVKAWHQNDVWRPASAYEDYDQFIAILGRWILVAGR